MSLKYGKAQITKMIEALDGDYETVEQAALAALAAAEEIFEDRAKFVVVGQLKDKTGRSNIPPTDPEAIKLSLGWYSTEGDATSAASSLWHSNSTGDTFRTWVLPVFHGTPADLHAKQKEKYEKEAIARKKKASDKIKADIEKNRLAMEERARGGKGSCLHCSHQPYDHSMLSDGGRGRGKCWLPGCSCTKWEEKKK
jgi:hypothetical protein